MNLTPQLIKNLEPNEVFVFGSNLSGIHGKGAAKTALQWGAKRGIGVGRSGQTYAIPTRGTWNRSKRTFNPLELDAIGEYIWDFLAYAKHEPESRFLVTLIGCGYAGFHPADIGRLFGMFEISDNVSLPHEFWCCVKEYRERFHERRR